MKKFWTQFFTWWNGQTLGTRFHTWRSGKRVGEDELGNVYYEGGVNSDGHTRRWVIYIGYAEGSAVPPAGTAGSTTGSTRRHPPRITRRANGRSPICPISPAVRLPIARRARS